MKSRLLVVTIATTIAIVLCEGLLWILGIPAAQGVPGFSGAQIRDLGVVEDRDVFWRLAPDNPYWSVDASGLRGFVPTAENTSETYRIACCGDSCTFGIGVTYEQTYGQHLERTLQAEVQGGLVEAVLCATPAFSSHQTRRLYERDLVPLEPDLTVLYLGAWNDYQPKMEGATDRQLAQRLDEGEPLPRTARVLSRLSFEDQRVPLEDFRTNLVAMIDRAKEIDSAIVLIVPPVRADTVRAHPICLEYQAAVRAIAKRKGLPFVDGPEIFAACESAVGPEWTEQPNDGSPLFVDGAHPSPFGHWLLAEALLAQVRIHADEKLLALFDSTPPKPGTGDDYEIEGGANALHSSEIRIVGPDPSAVSRVRIGELWAPHRIVDDRQLVATLPDSVRPGPHPVTLLTRRGPVRIDAALDVRPPTLEATAGRQGDRRTITITTRGTANRQTGIYLSTSRLEQPDWTVHGRFELASEAPTRPDGYDRFPYRFPPLAAHGATDSKGTWTTTIPWPSDVEELFVQGFLLMTTTREEQSARGPIGTVTNAVRVRLPQ